jgi:HEAT repeat protein
MGRMWQSWWWRLRDLTVSAPAVASDLTHPQPERRWRAVKALAGRPWPRYQASLLALLDDPDPIVRDEAAATLASWGVAFVLEPALDRLRQDPPGPRAAALLELLARLPATAEARRAMPDPAAVVGPFLDHADPLVRAAACRALAAGGRREDAGLLLSRMDDPDARVRRAACVALGRLGNPEAIPGLQARLTDADPPTRQLARQALSRLEAIGAAGQPGGGPPEGPSPP